MGCIKVYIYKATLTFNKISEYFDLERRFLFSRTNRARSFLDLSKHRQTISIEPGLGFYQIGIRVAFLILIRPRVLSVR